MGIVRVLVAGVLGLGPLVGSAPAHADPDRLQAQEQQACRLMDDPAGRDQGYAPAEYAFMVLRATMSAEDARNAMSLGVQDYCPNHLTDLPASWR